MTIHGKDQVQPTVFHLTHQKAGSQWVREILKYSYPKRFISQEFQSRQITQKAIIPGKIYTATYLPYKKLNWYLIPNVSSVLTNPKKKFLLQNFYNFKVLKLPYKFFFVIRDLRDTLVSLYFSKKVSHSILSEKQRELRNFLQSNSIEDGMLFLLANRLKSHANIQNSWADKNIKVFRYEDLLVDPYRIFTEIVNYCEIEVEADRLHQIIENNLFKNVTGRNCGDEDINDHLRKGISGDWKNYFSPKLISEFKRLYGNTLINTGYEQGYDW